MANDQRIKTWKLLKKTLIDLDLQQQTIAQELGISTQRLNNIIRGTRGTIWIREAIARRLGLPIELVWPPEHDRKAA